MKIKIGLMAVLSGVMAYGQEAPEPVQNRVFTLETAQQYALEHSYAIRNQQHEIEKAQQSIRETAALYYPQISANYELRNNSIIQPVGFDATQPLFPGIPVDPNPEHEFNYVALGGGKWQTSAGISANWLIGSYSNFLAKRASEVLKEMRNLDKEEAEILVSSDVAKAFYRVLLVEESMELLSEDLASLQKNLFETRQLFQNGFVDEQDVDQIELLLSNIDNSLENTRRQRLLSMQMLKFQMGIPLEQEIEIEGSMEESMLVVEKQLVNIETRPLKIEEHVGYKKVNSQYRASVLQYKNEKADLYPVLSFNASYNNFYLDNNLNPLDFNRYWAPGAFVAGTVRWELFTGFSRDAQAQRAKIDIQRAEVARETTRSQLKMQYDQAKSDFLFALQSYRNAKKNMGIGEKIRDRTRIKYMEGISSSLDLSQAENQYIDTQTNYIQALQSLLFAKEELEKALGIINF